jgi:16S rRNA (uracil1498-N3)-methyltransferase
MRQFFVRAEAVAGGRARLDDPAALWHLRRVLRLAPGERLRLADERGRRWEAVLEQDSGGEASFRLLAELPAEELLPPLALAVALARGGAFEECLDLGTQLGATLFQPLATERTQVRLEAKDLPGKLERWGRIVREASKQCNRALPPQVLAPCPLESLAPQLKGERALLAWEKGGQPLEQALEGLAPGAGLWLLVGPEGGFSPAEADWACQAGALPVSLGPRLLRTPVACAALLARAGAFPRSRP